MSKEPNINQFLADQLQNSIKLLHQNTTIGNTHVLYPATIVDNVLQTLNNIGAALMQNSTTTPTPVKNQKPATEETKVITESLNKVIPNPQNPEVAKP